MKAPVSTSPASGRAGRGGWPVRHGPAPGRSAEAFGLNQSRGVPGLDVAQLFGEARRVGGGGVGFPAEDRRDLVLAMAIARRPAEAQDHDIRPVAANDPDDIPENSVMAPLFKGFRGRLGEAEIDRAGEELLGAIDAPGRQQLLGTDESELRALLGADEVLPALPARHREVGGSHVTAAREIGQHRGALIVRMGRDHEHRTEFVQPMEGLLQFRRAGEALLCRYRRKCGKYQCDGKKPGR